MATWDISGGLGRIFGSFGTAIIRGLQSIGGSIADALGLGREVGASPIPEIVTREWGQVKIEGDRESSIARLRPWESVPHDLFDVSDIPWNRPIAYKAVVYGRDLSTGRFSHQEYDITVSRELTIQEAIDETKSRLGAVGQSPAMDMFDVKIIGASIREGQELW